MKKKIVFGLIIIALLLGLGFVNAEYNDKLISGKGSEDREVIDNSVFEGNNEITSSGKIINGNQFLCGNNVTIEDEVINGDVYIAGNQIKIKDDVTINGNVFAAGSNIEVNGKVERDLYAMGQYVLVDKESEIGYTAYIGGNKAEVKGTINRDLNIGANDVSVVDSAKILGDLNYSSTNEGNISKNSISGKVNFDKQVIKTKSTTEIVFDYCMSLLRNMIFVLFIFLFVLFVFPRFLSYSKEYIGVKLLKSLGIGLASIIVIPIMAIILMAVSATFSLGLFLIPIFIVIFAISESIFVISVSSKVNERFNNIKLPIIIPVVTLLLWLIKKIPVIGGFVSLFVLLSGIGMIIQSIFRKKNVSE